MKVSLNWIKEFTNIKVSTENLVELIGKRLGAVEGVEQVDGDTIIELENKMFTHRPDCFGILGVARELAGIQHLRFTSPSWYAQMEGGRWKVEGGEKLPLEVQNEIPKLVPRFMAVAVDGIKIGPSPKEMQTHLKRVGIKPINNIVDITNYVMYLTAQPMHAFDYHKIAKLSGKTPTLGVRLAKSGENLTVLGGKKLKLTDEDMVLTTDKQAVDLAGIMGGADSEVDEKTSAIILSCCTFDMYAIRRSAMRHGIFTEAATRYTKGQSPLQNDRVVAHALQLISEHTGGKAASEIFDLRSKSHESRAMNHAVKINTEFINERLGTNLSAKEMQKLLENVEFSVDLKSGTGELDIQPPLWRMDIELPEDIVEEVGRLYGYDQLPIQLPPRSVLPAQPEALISLKRQVRDILSRAGANEVLTYSFAHSNLLQRAGQKEKDSYQVANALSPDLQYYRQTLTPSILDKIHPNIKAGHDSFALFEIGKTHSKVHGLDSEKVPGELQMIALSYTSKRAQEGVAYYRARRYLDFLMEAFGLTLSYEPLEDDPGYPVTSPFQPGRCALVTTQNCVFVGIVGEYKPEVAEKFKLPSYSAGFEIGTDHLLEAIEKLEGSSYKPLPPYPSVEQDMTLRVPSTVTFGALQDELSRALESMLPKGMAILSMQPLSIFEKGKQQRHISFRLKVASYERTLTDQEVNDLLDQAAATVRKTLKTERI